MQTVGIIKGRITGPTSVELDEPVTSTGTEVEVWLKVSSPPPATTNNSASMGSEKLLDETMLRKGLISNVPPDPTPADIARFLTYAPIIVEGKPISASIIEDRR